MASISSYNFSSFPKLLCFRDCNHSHMRLPRALQHMTILCVCSVRFVSAVSSPLCSVSSTSSIHWVLRGGEPAISPIRVICLRRCSFRICVLTWPWCSSSWSAVPAFQRSPAHRNQGTRVFIQSITDPSVTGDISRPGRLADFVAYQSSYFLDSYQEYLMRHRTW